MLIHPIINNSARSRPSKCRVTKRWRALFSPFNRVSRPFLLLAAGVLTLTGCGAASFELTRPDGVTVRASAIALFRDTGLEGFNYSVDEKSRGKGLLPATEARSATVGAKGYTGTTKAETLIKLLEALP